MLGKAYLSQGKVEDALGELRETLRDQPEFSEARLALASALRQKGDLYEAIGHYQEYLRLRPQDGEARLVLAFVGLNHGVGPELPACAPTPWRESSTGRPGAAPSVHPQPHEGR